MSYKRNGENISRVKYKFYTFTNYKIFEFHNSSLEHLFYNICPLKKCHICPLFQVFSPNSAKMTMQSCNLVIYAMPLLKKF